VLLIRIQVIGVQCRCDFLAAAPGQRMRRSRLRPADDHERAVRMGHELAPGANLGAAHALAAAGALEEAVEHGRGGEPPGAPRTRELQLHRDRREACRGAHRAPHRRGERHVGEEGQGTDVHLAGGIDVVAAGIE
jgi:hypothetical protein